jgi:hypothetical protein
VLRDFNQSKALRTIARIHDLPSSPWKLQKNLSVRFLNHVLGCIVVACQLPREVVGGIEVRQHGRIERPSS